MNTARLAPTQPGERIEVLDVLRGFAIFGILLVNMSFFSGPLYSVVTDVKLFTGAADRAADGLIRFFAEGKFYSLFSFLFGLGFSLQMMRAETRGARFPALYLRRIFILLLIGLGHAFLIWYGDILVTYAVLGSLLVFFRTRRERTLLAWAAVLLLVPVLMYAGFAALLDLGRANPRSAQQLEQEFTRQQADYRARFDASMRVYAGGTIAEIQSQRTQDTLYIYSVSVFRGVSNIFAMFLLGLWAGRSRIFQDVTAHLALFRTTLRWGLALGLAGNAVFTLAAARSNPSMPSWMETLAKAGFAVGGPALCFFYAAAIVLLFQNVRWRARLAPLAAVGRTALSNYLLQSVVCTMIFYSYGLGFFGRVGPAVGLALTFVIYAAQIPLSAWWLRRYRYGPAEWLWRSLTYGKLQPMRLSM